MANESAPQPAPPAASPSWRKRVLAWGLALTALTFVAYVVPLRDRCVDPFATTVHAPTAKPVKVAVSRDDGGCTLHRATGDARLAPDECAQLQCEPGLLSTFARARLGVVAALLALYFAGTFAWASRWHALLALAGVKIGRGELWRITLEAQSGGILLPGGVAGDALRVGFVVSKGADLTLVIASVLLDRVLGLATLTGGAAVLGAVYGGSELGPVLFILGGIPVAFVVGLALLRWPRFAKLPIFDHPRLAKIARPVLAYVGHPGAPRALLVALVFSLFVSLTQFVELRGLLLALDATPALERWVYLGTAISFVVAALPVLPGGWGTSDAAFVFFFKKAGISEAVGLAASLIYRLFWYCSGGVGAVLYLLRQHGAGRNAEPKR